MNSIQFPALAIVRVRRVSGPSQTPDPADPIVSHPIIALCGGRPMTVGREISTVCGIAGWAGKASEASAGASEYTVSSMLEALRHRGPDSRGIWIDPDAGVALGTARLAIHDLTADGSQPMTSSDGRYVLSFNGEVYNFRGLRHDLEGQGARFRGNSDTEVLITAIQEWGLHHTLEKANGMFAFALWDSAQRTLVLARDRIGEKPLYYSVRGGQFVFASELGAMQRHPLVSRNVDREALALLLRHNYVPSPWSILEGTRKLPAGCAITVKCHDDGVDVGEPAPYWSLRDAVVESASRTRPPNYTDAPGALEDLLLDAVTLRMEADVPVGAFLSGGVDSSLVVALMQRLSRGPVKTFTIASSDSGFDESTHAANVAAHLGTDHVNLEVSAAEALAVIPRLPLIYSEPFADPSQIPTFLVSELARHDVTVTLSGDGGDELFGGYNRHRWVDQIWHSVHRIPAPLRRGAGAALAAVPPFAWRKAGQLIPPRRRPRNLDLKAQKLARVLDASTPWDMYQRLLSSWEHSTALVLEATTPDTAASDRSLLSDIPDMTTAMMTMDALMYLPDDVLVKLDRATMAVGLEGRAPLLDHRVINFAFQLPPSMKIRDGQSKWILREVLHRYVPPELTDRPKTGFDVPIASWLRGPLKAWASDLLDPASLRRQGYVRAEPIARVWRSHQAGLHDHSWELWSVLMFQEWLRHHEAQ